MVAQVQVFQVTFVNPVSCQLAINAFHTAVRAYGREADAARTDSLHIYVEVPLAEAGVWIVSLMEGYGGRSRELGILDRVLHLCPV